MYGYKSRLSLLLPSFSYNIHQIPSVCIQYSHPTPRVLISPLLSHALRNLRTLEYSSHNIPFKSSTTTLKMPREYSSSSSSRSSHYPSDAKSSSQGNWCPLYLPTFSMRTPHTSQPINYTDSQLISYHITEKAYKPSGSTTKSSGSTTKSSSHRTSSNPKVVIDYPSTYKDPDRRSKYQDSSYLPWGIASPPLYWCICFSYKLYDTKILIRYPRHPSICFWTWFAYTR